LKGIKPEELKNTLGFVMAEDIGNSNALIKNSPQILTRLADRLHDGVLLPAIKAFENSAEILRIRLGYAEHSKIHTLTVARARMYGEPVESAGKALLSVRTNEGIYHENFNDLEQTLKGYVRRKKS